MIIVEVIFNLALLVSVSVLSGFIDTRWNRSTSTGAVLQGLLFGLVALLGMLNPFVLKPGLIFDGRSVVLSLCASFFGPLSAVIAAAIALIYRIWLGGPGVYMGTSVIVSSTLVGLWFHYLVTTGRIRATTLPLYVLGLIVHLIMVTLILAIPSPMRAVTFKTLTLTILGFYPLATTLIGKILKDQADSLQKKQAENNLRENERMLNDSQKVSEIGSYTFNIETGRWKGSAFMYDMFGLGPYGEYTLEDWLSVVHPDDRQMLSEYFEQEVLLKKNRFDKEYRIISRIYDRERWVHGIGEIELDKKGRPLKIIGILQDITDRKRTENEMLIAKETAEAGNRLKSAILNNISHEVRTPLNGILGFSELICQPDFTDAERAEFDVLIQENSHRLLNTINNYIDIAMIASGTLKPKLKEFELQPLMESLRQTYLKDCSSRHLELSMQMPGEGRNPSLYSDAELLRKAMAHLLDNAMKFTNQGKIDFGYSILSGKLDFFVKDTGIGISIPDQARIFGEFVQADASHSRGYEGSGLGLSIAAGILKLLGSEIKMISEPGKGSAFYFSLPYTQITSTMVRQPGAEEKPSRRAKPFILITEDENTNARFLETVLNMAGFDTAIAVNGDQALTYCLNHPEISLILMDLKMPVMDGLTAVREIRKFNATIPIIALTAYAMSGDEANALEAGCTGYIPKPVKREDLIALVTRQLAGN